MPESKRNIAVFRRPLGLAAIAGGTVLLALVVAGPLLWGDQASATNPSAILMPPSWDHWFGTDAGGRDVLARTLAAGRLSIGLAMASTVIAVSLGTMLGVLPAVLPIFAARFISSFLGFAIAFPALLLTIVISLTLGIGAAGAVLAIGFASAPVFGRLVYTLSASVAGRDFILAARVLGVGRLKILFRHIIPNVREPLLVNASVMAAAALTALAGLSYLGLGVQAPAFDWGRLLSEGLSRIYVNPGVALAPILAVVFAGVVFSLIGETLARYFGSERSSKLGRSQRAVPRPADQAAPHPAAPVDSDVVLRVAGLSVAVPAAGGWQYPVRNVSFQLNRGEVVGLVGESGSGKSLTCLAVGALIQRPIDVIADSVWFDGAELVAGGRVECEGQPAPVAKKLGTRMSYVFQDPAASLNPALRVGYQVAEPLIVHERASRRRAFTHAVEQLRNVRIASPERRARQYPDQFSGGMRQRAMIAMGLIENPALLLADEPTTALDVTVQKEILRLIKRVSVEKAAAVLLVSHDLAVVTGMCSRVLVMYRGEIVEEISTEDLLEGKARHPYTRALLDVIPDESAAVRSRFTTIPDNADFTKEVG